MWFGEAKPRRSGLKDAFMDGSSSVLQGVFCQSKKVTSEAWMSQGLTVGLDSIGLEVGQGIARAKL
ncbi:hypothetical protein RJ639_013106 [Escallonia herrerae]|uniref:Uncharacterized protein n=1 Tax=Escallonia herrerae TaxID=1293975 RepID=A0AA88VI84_9ASTE|nr:hypothetical protein RJ639_013106 [Escallonia herrerae]